VNSLLVTPPAKRPVSVGEVKAHARIETELEEALLYGWLVEAVDRAEAETGRRLITQTWDSYYDAWPACADAFGEVALALPFSPAKSIGSVKYVDPAAALQTLDPARYRLDAVPLRPRLVFNGTLPATASRQSAIVVRWVAGYGDNPADVPEAIRQWIIVQVATRDQFREALADRAVVELPRPFVDGLLDPYRVPVLG